MIVASSVERNRFAAWALFFVLCASLAAGLNNNLLLTVPFACLLFSYEWAHRDQILLLTLIVIPVSVALVLPGNLGLDFPDEPLMLMTSFLFISAIIFSPGLIAKQTWSHPLVILAAMLFLWTTLSVIFSSFPVLSIKFLAAKTWYVGAFFIAPMVYLQKNESAKKIVLALILPMTAVVLLVLLRQAATGFHFATVNDALAPFFRNHVVYSALLSMLLPFSFAIIRLTPPGRLRNFSIAMMIILTAGLLLSFSRGAWLAVFAAAMAWWLTKRRLLVAGFLLFIFLSTGFAFWLRQDQRYLRYAPDFNTTVFHRDFAEHIVATYKLKDVSTAERFYRWIAGVRMLEHESITGFGPGTFYENYKSYASPAYKTWVSDNNDHSTIHNYFLLTAVEQGIPGLVMFCCIIATMFYYAQRIYRRSLNRTLQIGACAAAASLTAFVVVNFLSDLVETDKIGSLFFLLLAWFVFADMKTTKEVSEATTDI